MMPPTINIKLCNGCGSCVDVCPAGVLALEGKKAKVVNASACLECRACEVQCAQGAIALK